ncbi:MAG: type III PLP-dependent enzyme [Hyphomicrobiales bacterium]
MTHAAIHNRIYDFFDKNDAPSPCIVIDTEIVADNFKAFQRAMPETSIYYAIKANPAPEILRLLASLGSSFDAASITEVEMALAAGAAADKLSFSNTIKKEADIAKAHRLGVTLFAVDCIAEVEKVARAAPGASVFCRILTDNEGAEWPLSRKFGCDASMALEVLDRARQLGLQPNGISFHVGSQQTNIDAWDQAIAQSAVLFKKCEECGIELKSVNLGGGFPTQYLSDIPDTENYSTAIYDSLKRHFGNRIPATMIEPGRGMVGNAGIIKSEVVLISQKSETDPTRWVYLDIGKFGGLAETMDEAIRYPFRHRDEDGETSACVIAGPTCDGMDILYEKNPYPLPLSLTIGDELFIENTGAYTTTYASNGFNGFAPLKQVVI